MNNLGFGSIFNYNKTDKPALWKDTYWGGGGGCTSSHRAATDIIRNRNEFANEFNEGNAFKYYYTHTRLEKLHNKVELRPDYMNGERKPSYGQLTDHSEYYINRKMRIKIIVFSPYHIDDEHRKLAENNGFVEYKKLYMPCALTFIKVIPF